MVTHTMAFVKPVTVPLVETEDGTNEDGSAGDRTGDRPLSALTPNAGILPLYDLYVR